jgi:hypothetical protein
VQTLFIVYFFRCCQRKRKKEKKVLLPTGVSKSTAHTATENVTVFGDWSKVKKIINVLISPSNFYSVKFKIFSLPRFNISNEIFFLAAKISAVDL